MSLMRIIYLVRKDLIIEFRRGHEILSSLAFIIGASIIISEASYRLNMVELTTPSLMVILVFLSIFNSMMTSVREADKRTLYNLRLIPMPPVYLYYSKIIFSLIISSLEALIVILTMELFTPGANMLDWRIILPVSILIIQLSIVSSFVSALVMYSEGRSFLIPMLIIIFIVPILPAIIILSSPTHPTTIIDYILIISSIIATLLSTSALSQYLLSV